jgi:hypothetical protein
MPLQSVVHAHFLRLNNIPNTQLPPSPQRVRRIGRGIGIGIGREKVSKVTINLYSVIVRLFVSVQWMGIA